MENTEKILRFAPSPTGNLHIGSARTALFNYLYAKQNKAKLILRYEDTDKERSKREFEEDIESALRWLDLSFDETYYQSRRINLYKSHLEKMVKAGAAYVSSESKGERSEVIRFKNPNSHVKFTDLIRGEIKFDTTELKDFVIAKSFDEPLYHLGVVIDDHEMKVTHIIRGEDHISNTARQILIQEAIGANRPLYAHIPLILAHDRSKLSKRHGAVAVNEYKNKGYLKDAMINYLALLGWHPDSDSEIFSMAELISDFRLDKVQKGGAIFNLEKLDWINRQYIKKLPAQAIIEATKEALGKKGLKEASLKTIEKMSPLIKEKITVLSDIEKMADSGELSYFFQPPSLEAEKLLWRDQTKENAAKNLSNIIPLLESLTSFTSEDIKKTLWDLAESVGKGNLLWPFRYALTGKDKSPDPFQIASILGKDETTKRINSAIFSLNK